MLIDECKLQVRENFYGAGHYFRYESNNGREV